MPRYFFNIVDSDRVPDEEGSEHPDLASARTYALANARDIIAGDVRKGLLPLSFVFVVTDEAGETVLTVPFSEAVQAV